LGGEAGGRAGRREDEEEQWRRRMKKKKIFLGQQIQNPMIEMITDDVIIYA